MATGTGVQYAKALTARQHLAARGGVTTSGGAVAPSPAPMVPVLFGRLPDGDLTFTDLPPVFAGFVSDSYGDLVTDGDGWEDIVNNIVSDLASVVGDLPNMGDHATNADFQPGQFESTHYVPLIQSADTFANNYDALVSAYNTATTVPGTGGGPPPPPPPPPPGGGGGGGTSGPCPPGMIRFPDGSCAPIVGGGGPFVNPCSDDAQLCNPPPQNS